MPWAAVMALLTVPVAQAQTVTLKPCHLPGLRDAVQCGKLARPLDPAAPQGTKIDIHFAVVPSKAREKHVDPIYFFAGGPGQSAMDVLAAMQGPLSRLNNRRDLVFVDQRGTGKSAPLVCDDTGPLSLRVALDPQQLPLRMASCRAALEKLPHGDLRFYSTTLAMQDIDAVRAALGQERINLMGVSYGTRAALEYLRQFAQRVRRIVLDGVVPTDISLTQSMAEDANAAWMAIVNHCAADAACAKRHSTLAAQWEQLFAALPQTTTVDNPLTGNSERVTVTANMLAGMVRGTLYTPALASALPFAIDEAAHGRWTALVGLASAGQSRSGSGMAMGMHFSVLCAEDPLRTSSSAAAGRFAGVMDAPYQAVCKNWPSSKVDPGFYTVAASAAPVLMLSGGADPATPPHHAAVVAAALGKNVRHIVVDHAGHGILRLGCASDVVFKFVDNAASKDALGVDAACLAHIPRPKAFVPLRDDVKGRS